MLFCYLYIFRLEIANRDVFNKNSNNASWIKNEPAEMVDGNMDLTLGLGELAQLTVNNESESNADVSYFYSVLGFIYLFVQIYFYRLLI